MGGHMKTQFVETKGAFTDMNLTEIEKDTERYLEAIGRDAMNEMKHYTEPFDDEGTLTESITGRTHATYNPISNSEHLIEKPDNKYAVDIGSKAPHAFFRENGTGPHMHPEGSQEFMDAVKGWAFWKGMREEEASKVIWAIRKRGTAKHPFAYPMSPKLHYIASKYFNVALKHLFTRGSM
jgi:hypothetical protein